MNITNIFKKSIVLAAIMGLIAVSGSVVASAATNQVTGKKASLSLVTPKSGSVETGKVQAVKWSSTNYPASAVSVRLIRKVATSPARYEVARTISNSTANDGNAIWVPTNSDVGANLSLEIGCKPSAVACQAANSVGSSLAVIKSNRYAYTASAFQAIEAALNK